MATKTLDIREILRLIPHRWPFVMIDRVTEFTDGGDTLKAIKNVTYNEAHFPGHFPAVPTMPGVLVIEAMAQASGLLTQLSQSHPGGPSIPLYYLVKVDKARFSKTVGPGDQLRLEVQQKRVLKRMGLFVCRALVDGDEVASAELLCAERSR